MRMGSRTSRPPPDAAKALQPDCGRVRFRSVRAWDRRDRPARRPGSAGSAAYALGEALDWRVGLAEKPGRAPAFYIAIAAGVFVGALLNLSPLDPVKALFWSAVVNGVAAAPIMIMIMHHGFPAEK